MTHALSLRTNQTPCFPPSGEHEGSGENEKKIDHRAKVKVAAHFLSCTHMYTWIRSCACREVHTCMHTRHRSIRVKWTIQTHPVGQLGRGVREIAARGGFDFDAH